jgi:hypothetical protein
MRARRITIRGKRWTVKGFDGDHPPGEKAKLFGLCDYATRTVWISNTQTELDRLDTLIHELMHAALPDLCEDAVAATASVIAVGVTTDLLTRAGLVPGRRVPPIAG